MTTDLGHQRAESLPQPGADAFWGLWNPNGIIEFAYLGQHKATVVTKALIDVFYRQPQRYAYSLGVPRAGATR
jgi:Tannase and feruloyl esterase